MKYKMIVLDMDDTLLLGDNTIGSHTKNALMKAQEMGVKVVLASGRPVKGMKKYAEELQLDHFGSYIMSYNGAKIINCRTKEELFSSMLQPKTVHHLYELSKRENVWLHTFIDDRIITEENNKYTSIESELNNLPIEEVNNLVETITIPVVKVLMCEHPDKLVVVEEKLKKELGDELSIFRSKPYFLEFIEHGVTKGSSLAKLLKETGMSPQEVIAVGDSYNDATMIELAGLGVAMGNAPDDIKQKADYVTDTFENEGVATVIEEFLLKK
ncbi:Cof-type HAD-IIB family hydrolase [Evansella sp. AB-rgal1]|uniref:Cof-type HAD-IIB family hydrolase n=1 Tax=Evansella sp. AB-rgal1 TaxID=3242696 RepID=UPI00359D9BF3